MIVVGVFVVYGILLYIEAGVRYQRSRNRQELVVGIVPGTLLIVAALLVGFQLQVQFAASIGVGTTLAMLASFGSRFSRSRKFIPAGLMLTISVVAFGVLAGQVFGN